ncbi:hypothetical protein FNF28_05212 [Cafeteria roenbergensis]|uniref:GATOR2 complex protein MIO zinc-ribbon like domain-containing protein n=1 Tax=Cafeteria roenbergensis TaxID=33653 RepID=A0A5A8D745_CAFRO|nr:hypothetical protein FNF28_05212 [Cafeteria roenbergensis]
MHPSRGLRANPHIPGVCATVASSGVRLHVASASQSSRPPLGGQTFDVVSTACGDLDPKCMSWCPDPSNALMAAVGTRSGQIALTQLRDFDSPGAQQPIGLMGMSGLRRVTSDVAWCPASADLVASAMTGGQAAAAVNVWRIERVAADSSAAHTDLGAGISVGSFATPADRQLGSVGSTPLVASFLKADSASALDWQPGSASCLAVALMSRTVVLVDSRLSHSRFPDFTVHLPSRNIVTVQYEPGDASSLLTSTDCGDVRVWDLRMLDKPRSVIESSRRTTHTGLGFARWCPGQQGLVSTLAADGLTVELWDERRQQIVAAERRAAAAEDASGGGAAAAGAPRGSDRPAAGRDPVHLRGSASAARRLLQSELSGMDMAGAIGPGWSRGAGASRVLVAGRDGAVTDLGMRLVGAVDIFVGSGGAVAARVADTALTVAPTPLRSVAAPIGITARMHDAPTAEGGPFRVGPFVAFGGAARAAALASCGWVTADEWSSCRLRPEDEASAVDPAEVWLDAAGKPVPKLGVAGSVPGVVLRCLAEGAYERAAALAVWHGDLRLATAVLRTAAERAEAQLKALQAALLAARAPAEGGAGAGVSAALLQAAADDRGVFKRAVYLAQEHRELMQLTAMAVAGFPGAGAAAEEAIRSGTCLPAAAVDGGSHLWADTCDGLRRRMRSKHPYLRCICAFLAACARPDAASTAQTLSDLQESAFGPAAGQNAAPGAAAAPAARPPVEAEWSTSPFLSILVERGLRRQDRAAFAARFLPDSQLLPFTRALARGAIMDGNILGLVLTGFTNAGVRVIQAYVDRTGDVHTAALLACFFDPSKVSARSARRALRWLQSFRDLLNRWKLWRERATLDVQRAKMVRSMEASKAAVKPSWRDRAAAAQPRPDGGTGPSAPAGSAAGAAAAAPAPAAASEQEQARDLALLGDLEPAGSLPPQVYSTATKASRWQDPSRAMRVTRRALPGGKGRSSALLTLCLISMVSINPYKQWKLQSPATAQGRAASKPSSGREVADAPAVAPHLAVDEGDRPVPEDSANFSDWWTWCQSCRHGGHASHLAAWFKGHDVCPISGCGCRCRVLDERALASSDGEEDANALLFELD